jgi:NitT/TauT family transport system substrate-binding protein
MKHKTIFIIISLVVVLSLFIAFKTNHAPLQEVRMANLPITEGLPLYIAIDKGYFKNAGIDLKYTRFEAPNQIIDAVMAGTVDMVSPSGAMGISAVADSKNPGKLKVFAASGGNLDNPLNGLFVGNDSNIHSIEGLKGKKIGILPGIQWRTIGTEILNRHGLKVGTDVTLVELAPGLHSTALASGEVDAVLTLEPNPTIIREKKLGKEIAPTPTIEISNPFYAGAGIINTDFLKKNPELVKRVIQILDKANKEIRDNPQEARKHLVGYTSLIGDLVDKVRLPIIKIGNEITEEDIKSIQDFYAIFYTNKVVEKPLNFKALMYQE